MMPSYLIAVTLAVGQVGRVAPPDPNAPAPGPSPELLKSLGTLPPPLGAQLPSPGAVDKPKSDDAKKDNGEKKEEKAEEPDYGFFRTFFKTYKDEFYPPKDKKEEEETPERPRRALPVS